MLSSVTACLVAGTISPNFAPQARQQPAPRRRPPGCATPAPPVRPPALRHVKPAAGLEPTTTGLQNRCSTVELRRHHICSYVPAGHSRRRRVARIVPLPTHRCQVHPMQSSDILVPPVFAAASPDLPRCRIRQGRPFRFASCQAGAGGPPGSVGKVGAAASPSRHALPRRAASERARII